MAEQTLEQVLRTYTETDIGPRPVLNFLQDIQIPIPGPGQFLEANQGAIIGHPRAGIVLRIERDKMALDHPLTAPIVGRFNTGCFSIELVVGGRTTGLNNKDCAWVNKHLRQTGAYWRDAKSEDLMRLPLATKQHPNGLPVILDREFIYESPGHSFMSAAAKLLGIKRPEPQLEDFGVSPSAAKGWRQMMERLENTLENSFDKTNGKFDQEKIANFWQLAEDYTSPRFNMNMPLLFRGWEETNTTPTVIETAYGSRMSYREKNSQFACAMQAYVAKTGRRRKAPSL